MRNLGNHALLALLTSAIASCGGLGEVLQSDAGDHDSAIPNDAASNDGASNFDSGALPDGTSSHQDSAADTSVDAPAASPDGCAPGTLPDSDGGCHPITVRRPFLVGASMRAALAVRTNEWSRALPAPPHPLDGATAERLARTWLRDALEEHASIAAFARFTMHLLSVGAPPDLVARSQRASLDEIRHARLCFAFAERYGAIARGPAPLSMAGAMQDVSLAEIAALAAEEGCVGETLGAALAAEQVAIARDPEAARALSQIAADEARHAELAWRFAAWAIARGGERVAEIVSARVERAIASTLAMEIQSYDGIDLDAWHAHGRLTCLESRAIAERAIHEVVRPCLRAVLARVAHRGESHNRSDGQIAPAPCCH